MVLLFKGGWKRWQANALALAFILVVIFAAARGFGMLGPRSARPLLPLGFVVMMVLPFIFLTARGRQQIGLTKSNSSLNYLTAILFGVCAALLCFILGVLLFQKGPDNWFVTVRNYYLSQVPAATEMSLNMFFLVVTVPALIFSPIGEEIFFRGFLQDAFQTRFGLRSSIVIESAIFGVVHLFHHGLVRNNETLNFYPLSGMLWVALMFLTAFGFALLRKRSGSIYPSIVAHAFFNLTMNICIFSFLIE